jgi:gliding motility-associated protein GldM
MAGGNMSPRQKMIGMMYLVLTALLALNVSKDILNAFVIVNKGLEVTTASFGRKNDFTYKAFDFALKNDKNKVQDLYDRAQKIKQYSEEMVRYIEDLKKELYMRVDGLPKAALDTVDLEDIKGRDNMDVPGEILIGSTADGSTGKARKLKEKINEYKAKIGQTVKGIRDADKVDLGLSTSDPKASAEHGKQSWETFNFDHTPFAAVITLLSKLQSDVKNAESDMINFLYSNISASDFKFDALSARVVAPTSYILSGNEYKAEVFVSAYSTTQDPVIDISPGGNVDTVKHVILGGVNNSNLKIEKGVGKYTVRTSAEGIQKWGGVIKVKSPDGSFKSYSFKTEYMVAKPTAVVSATKMNVLYIGVDNPIEISVPGVDNGQVRPSISNGTLTSAGKKGAYIAKVTTAGEAVISVSADVGSGKVMPMGSMKYRIKRVPDPVAKIANMRGGSINKALLGQSAIIPVLENFDFDLYFVVTSFSMARSGKGRDPVEEKANGNQLTPAMKTIIGATRTGDKIYFEGIKAKGPDGTIRDLGSVSFTIQ